MSTENINNSTAAAASSSSDERTWARMKVAIIFGYVGYGYFGLQHTFDPAFPSVEAELVNALNSAGYISDENMIGQFMKKICWDRASRTDKGVSALRNVANAKLQLPRGKSEQEWIAPLNEILKPKKIKVFRMIHTCSSFDCYICCTGRKYEYLLPTYSLLPPQPEQQTQKHSADDDAALQHRSGHHHHQKLSTEIRDLLLLQSAACSDATTTNAKTTEDGDDENNNNNNQPEQQQQQQQQQRTRRRQRDDPTVEPTDISREIYEKMLNYRVSPETVHRLRGFFTVMEGTNSFHNFTPQVTADDASAMRFIRSITVSDPFIIPIELESNNNNNDKNEETTTAKTKTYQVEWVRIRLDGQSFMLNQIRKMVGCAVEVINRGGDAGAVRAFLSKNVRRAMPMAPANGLFLATMSMDKYNQKVEKIQEQGQAGAMDKEQIIIPDVPEDDEMRILVEKCIGEHECMEEITARWVVGLMRTSDQDWYPPVVTNATAAK